MARRRVYPSLYSQVLIATILGMAVGWFWPAAGVAMKPLGDGFVRAVRMIIAPVIFCSVSAGIASAGGAKAFGKTGLAALAYFEVVSSVALVIGLVTVNVLRPGAGMNVDVRALDATAVASYVDAGRAHAGAAAVLDIIPGSVVDAFAKGDILQVLFFSVLFGFALRSVGAAAAPVVAFVEKLSAVLFAVVGLIMRAAPLGAFGAMAFAIGTFGIGTLVQLGKLVACFYVTCALFVGIVLGGIARLHGFRVWRLMRYIKDEIFIVFGTSSSEAALPRLMEKLEDAGVDRAVVGVVVPAGYSFNLDGTAIYLAVATVFIAQATNTPLDLPRQLSLLALLLVTSKGSAGVAGAALVVLAATLAATSAIPVAGVALVLGIHRFMGEAMAVTNLIGNGVATVVVASWCGQLDRTRLAARLDCRGAASDEPLSLSYEL